MSSDSGGGRHLSYHDLEFKIGNGEWQTTSENKSVVITCDAFRGWAAWPLNMSKVEAEEFGKGERKLRVRVR